MTQFDAIIIGGGLGGLTAGATLSKHGKKVLLLEQHYNVGGCATTFKRKDYVMEVGLHEMDGLDEEDSKRKIFSFLGVDKAVTFLDAPEFYRYKSSTTDFVHPHGRQEALGALIERFPHEEKGIRTYLDTLEAVAREALQFPSQLWKKILVFPLMPFLYPHLASAVSQNLGDLLDEHIQDEELKLILAGNLGYYHDDPYSMSLITFAAAQSSFIRGGGHYIQGGSQKLSNYLACVIQESGGQVLLGKKVTKILVENDAACGVSFVDSFNKSTGETSIRAHRVVFNGAMPLVASLLPEPQAQLIQKKVDGLDISCSLISLYLGFDKPPRNKYYSTILAGDDVKSLSDMNQNFHSDWSTRNIIFVDYSQLIDDAKLAPTGKSVGAICTVDYLADWENLDEQAYSEKKENVAKVLISRLEKHIPGISNHIEHYELGTPRTMCSYVHTPQGTAYGFAQSPQQTGMGRPPSKSCIQNLSFAGAWSFPGGGFTGTIVGGYLCGTSVHKSLEKVPCALPEPISDSRYVQLVQKNQVATNTIELVFEKPAGFDYKAGQYAVVELEHPKYDELDMPMRSLSLVSHPDDEVVRFAMRLSQSSYKKSVDAMQIGERCRLFGPMGDLFSMSGSRGIVFLVSGIGITPVLPILKDLEKQCFSKKVVLFYSNRYESGAAYHEDLKAVNLAHYSYVKVITSKMPRINADLLKSKLASLDDFDYYLVGTSNFLRSMQELLYENGVDESHVVIDNFG